MEAAVQNMVPGIDADCGGACACATCHVYVGEAHLTKLKEKDDMEDSMLDFAEGVQDNSRLSCQILMNDELDGIEISTPESQELQKANNKSLIKNQGWPSGSAFK